MDLTRREFIAASSAVVASSSVSSLLPSGSSSLIVHEWGVATIPYGTSHANLRTAGAKSIGGVEQIPGLPEFVATWEATVKDAIEDWKNNPVPVSKPIVYFYSKEQTQVSLTVKIPTGRPSAWFPPADRYAPQPVYPNPMKGGDQTSPDPKTIVPKDGLLGWDALILDPAAKEFRDVKGWWKTARNVDAVPVRRDKEAEKFLFYDGFADYAPKAVVAWNKDGTVTVTNDSPEPFPAVIAIRVKKGECAFATSKLAKGASATLTLAKGAPDLAASLAGLYKKEADALVEIWTDEFFKTDGVRVLIVLAREAYDRLLPIEIKPAPAELVRVLIAHLECLDDERIAKIHEWIGELGAADLDVRDKASAKLKQLAPLAEPMIREAADKATDADVKGRLLDLLPRKK